MSVTQPAPETPPPAKPASAAATGAEASAPSTAVPNQPAEPGTVRTPEILDIYSGKELKEPGAVAFSAAQPTRLIVFAGPVGSGKTTLVTSLYELFQVGTVRNQRFSQSITLHGFETRCHAARLASKNIRAETVRTPYKGPDPDYLQLETRPIEPPYLPINFLFTDVSGEMFNRASDNVDECKELAFIERCEHFILLIDTARALEPDKWSMIQKLSTLLRSCIENSMIPKYCVVTVAWAKYDFYHAASPEAQKAFDEFRKQVTSQFETDFKNRVSELRFREVAARPRQFPSLGFGKGVPELFSEWIEGNSELRKIDLSPAKPEGTRESELFANRNPVTEVAP